MNADFDSNRFRETLGHYPTGICVITSIDHEGMPIGMTVGSFVSVSLSPPLVGFFPDRNSETWPLIERSGQFCVNILAEEQEALCQKFAKRGRNKFDGLPHRRSETGMPILSGSVGSIDCMIHAVHDAGDHLSVLGEVRGLEIHSDKRPLLFFRSGYARLHR